MTTRAAPGFPRRAGRRVDALLSNRRLPFWKLVAAPAAPSGLLARLPCPPSSPFTSELPDIPPISPGRRRGGALLSTKSAPGPPRPSFSFPILHLLACWASSLTLPHIQASPSNLRVLLHLPLFYEHKKMVTEKETLSLSKCPDKMPKRTKLRAPQSLPSHQAHSLVSEGFTVKAMMKNSVVSLLPGSPGTSCDVCWGGGHCWADSPTRYSGTPPPLSPLPGVLAWWGH